jgi:hypothetical protein
VAAPTKAWVCGRSLAATVGSNVAGGMDICLGVVRVICDELIPQTECSYQVYVCVCVFVVTECEEVQQLPQHLQ